MAHDSRSEREKLKEEYKAHYRKIREVKEQLSRSQKTQSISRALRDMDKSQMLDTFDDFLFAVKDKLAAVEARLDVAMENIAEEGDAARSEEELDEEMNREKAKDTLHQIKMEMGMLYEEIERQADEIQVNKTIGSNPPKEDSNNEPS